MRAALQDNDAARAVGAALDAGFEGATDGEDAVKLDEVLSSAGLYELLAVRLEARAERRTGLERSAIYEVLARLYAGPLSSPDRAIEAWIEALSSDPSCAAARMALRDHAAALHDPSPLVEALIRIGESSAGTPVDRVAALQELVTLAEERVGDPALASWALDKVAEAGGGEDIVRAEKLRLLSRIRRQEDGLLAARRAYEGADNPEARVKALRRLVPFYQGKFDERGEYVRALVELVRALPGERAFLLALERVSHRTGELEELSEVLEERAHNINLPRIEQVRARLGLAAIARRRGEEAKALAEVLPLLSEAPGHRGAACTALVLSTRLAKKARIEAAAPGEDATATFRWRTRERADALVQLAGPTPPSLRATLLAVAAELYAKTGEPELGRKATEQACEADPSCVRAVATLSALAGGSSDRAGALAVERAMGLALPRGAACAHLAQAHEALGEAHLALVWTQRWLALRPGSRLAAAELLRRAALCGDAERLAEALSWVLSQPHPLTDLTEPVVSALEKLVEIDRSKARTLARRALDVIGAKASDLRTSLIKIAERISDSGLAIAVLERFVAAEEPSALTIELLFDLTDRRIAAGDFDGAAREIARAAEGGADPDTVFRRLHALDEAMREISASPGSDGLIAAAEAHVAALDVLTAAESARVQRAPRRRGDRRLGSPGQLRRLPPPAAVPSFGEADAAPPARSDGLEVRSVSGSVQNAAASAFRELGSLLWDLAEDRRGAEAALFRAAELSSHGGIERYARDLFAFAGVDAAIEALSGRANRLHGGADAHKTRASLLIEAANLASAHGQMERALVAAASAIESDPSRADAVALVEKNAGVEGGLPILDHTYDLLAAAAMGRYGRRAAHYRGARQLERRGSIDLALRHAAACFEAVPADGTAYVLLARLVERAGDPGCAVRALERVAASSRPDTHAVWLVRAASLAGKSEEGVRKRLELLLQALIGRPDRTTVDLIGKALRELFVIVHGDEGVMLRFDGAIRASLAKLDGPDGARAAVGMARLAVEFGVNELAFVALTRAMNADGDIDEFADLISMVPEFAGKAWGPAARDHATAWIQGVCSAAERPYSSVGASLLRFASRLASALGDARTAATLLVQAVRRAPDNDLVIDEADVAVGALGDEALKQELSEVLPAPRRADALLHIAERHEREGQHDLAITVLERALSSGELRPEIHARAAAGMRSLLFEVGRIEEVEAMLQAELDTPDLSPAARAKAARELAESLVFRGESLEAVDVLAVAAQRGAATADLLTDLRALVRSTADPQRHAEVLTEILARLPADASRLPVLRELAPIAKELGDHAAALAHYEEISRLDPSDVEALEVLEREANERGDHETIAALLARRIGSAPPDDRRRMLRLRRAAVLEQRLGKLEEAAAELTELLDESPADVSALRFLADIQDRLGAKTAAGALLRHLGSLAATSDEKADYGIRASTAYLAGGDLDTAEQILETVAPIAEREAVLEIRVELARRRGDGRALSEELDRLAACSREPADRRAAILTDAARAAAAIGDDAAALDRARRAAKLAPGLPDAVLEARRLEYRSGGAGTPREAQGAVDDLMRIAPRLQPAHIELHAFLLAEELDVIQGGGAGMRELSRRHAEVGSLPLVTLGMAERLVRGKNFETALPLFEQALAGDLHGLRSRGRVALAAAEAAVSAEDYEAAERLLAAAAAEADTAVLAQRRRLELTAVRGEPAEAIKALEELIRQTSGVDRARAMVQLGRIVAPADREAAARLFTEAAPLATADRALSAQITEALAKLGSQPRSPSVPPPPTASSRSGTASVSPPPSRAPNDPSPNSPPPLPALALENDSGEAPLSLSPLSESGSIAPPFSGEPGAASPPQKEAPAPGAQGALADESELLRDLVAGSFEAGERLIALYGGRSAERAHDVLTVRRHQAAIRLGHPGVLRQLYEAAILDGNPVYARAVQHIVAMVDHSVSFPKVPPLASQRHAPDLVSALLFRNIADSKVHEALSIVLDTGLYRRDMAQYHLTGVARVQPGAATVLGEAFGTVGRFLGQGRTALFHVRVSNPTGAKIALLSPPGIVLTGDIRDETPELRYLLGASLAGAMPEHALVNALNEDALRTLLDALQAAFGPVANLPRGNAAVARLGQNLWQLVPPRADRRLRELCENPEVISYDLAVTGTRQAMRRAGLFAVGTLSTVLKLVAFEHSFALPRAAPPSSPVSSREPLLTPDGLIQVCERSPAAADLLRLAIRTEFAEARWLPAAAQERRRPDSGKRSRAGT
jgi:tetratricopeptide (TPR) repeat protein